MADHTSNAAESWLKPRVFDGHDIRILDRDGEPWFVLVDVCRVLEHSNPSQAASRLDDDERDTLTNNEGIADPQVQSLGIINESGLYSLVLTSRKPEAKRFKKWVTSEVLPSIRRTGHYALSQTETAPKKIANVARRAEEIASEMQEALCLVHSPAGLFHIDTVAAIFAFEPKRMHAYLRRHFLKREGEFVIPEKPAQTAAMFQVWAKHDAAGEMRLSTLVTPRGLVHLADRLDLGQISVSTMRNDVVS